MNNKERSVVHCYIATKNLKKMGDKEDTDKSASLMVRIQRDIRKRLLYTSIEIYKMRRKLKRSETDGEGGKRRNGRKEND